jgi:hypothetical protein
MLSQAHLTSKIVSTLHRWGGEGYSLSTDATGGITYGAGGGSPSARNDAFDYSYDEVVLYGNGSMLPICLDIRHLGS